MSFLGVLYNLDWLALTRTFHFNEREAGNIQTSNIQLRITQVALYREMFRYMRIHQVRQKLSIKSLELRSHH